MLLVMLPRKMTKPESHFAQMIVSLSSQDCSPMKIHTEGRSLKMFFYDTYLCLSWDKKEFDYKKAD